jgi:N-acetylmuramoyl-L-alanine amidase
LIDKVKSKGAKEVKIILLKKQTITWVALVGVVCFCLAGFAVWGEKQDKSAVEAMSWIVAGRVFLVDPGHGGEDPGKVSASGVLEKDINLAVAKKLYSLLVQGGGLVHLTRAEDKALSDGENTVRERKRADLIHRVEIIENVRANLYIAIHCNAFPSSRWFGAQTFYAPDVPGSKELATCIQEELTAFPGNTTRKPKADDSTLIFKRAQIPIVNVELGFLSNPKEEKLLQEEEYQQKLAWSIYAGIVRYLMEYGDEPH